LLCQENVQKHIQEAILSLQNCEEIEAQKPQSTRDMHMFTSQCNGTTKAFRHQQNKPLSTLKSYGNSNQQMSSFSVVVNNLEERVGNLDLPFFTEVTIIPDIHTVKISWGY